MFTQLKSAFLCLLLLTILVGVLYPLAVTGVAQLTMEDRASGSLVMRDGQPVGSRLIGQSFADPRFFFPRPSATGPSYNGAASSGSNLGPLNPALKAAVEQRAAALRAADPAAPEGPIPADLLLASGSGLDPHISPEAARFQAGRVARLRGLPAERVLALVDEHTEGRTLGFLGEPRVNVLLLNLALDELER